MQTHLKQVVRRNRKIRGFIGNRVVSSEVTMPVGVMVAKKIDVDGKDTVIVGVSKVNERDGDVFNARLGENVAECRINDQSQGKEVIMPTSLHKDVEKFVDRCKRYFKGCDVLPVRFRFPKTIAKNVTVK